VESFKHILLWGWGEKKNNNNNNHETESNLDKHTDGRSMKENEDIDITGMPTAEDATPKTVTGHPVLVKRMILDSTPHQI